MKGLYEGFKCHVVHEGKLTDSFEVTTRVRHGCILSPDPISCSARLCHEQDLDFADDICLLSQRWSDKEAKLEKL
jgi:hypothetical protein